MENSAVVAKTLDFIRAGDKHRIGNFFAGGDLLRSVSAIPIKFIPQRIWKNVVRKFRLSRFTERFVKKRERKGLTLELHVKEDKAVSNSEFVRKKKWDLADV